MVAGYNANQLKSLQQRQEHRQRLQVIVEATGYWVGCHGSGRRRSARRADNIEIVYWCYTKIARREMIFTQGT